MPEINLRELYPDQYNEDYFIEVSDAVAELFAESKRSEEAAKRKMYRYHAQYSLDQNDGIEAAVLSNPLPLSTLLEQSETRQILFEAFRSLTPVQARRIHAKYILNLSSTQIAVLEGISKRSVDESISAGLKKLRTIFSND